MNDKRLIVANELWEKLGERYLATDPSDPEQLGYLNARIIVRNQPTIDAVEVVRCRECIHHVRTKSNLGFSWCGKFGNVMRDSDFCSWGERKMDGGLEES